MLLIALSALQGKPQLAAFTALTALDVDGVQLTPGNLPDAGFESTVRASGVAFRGHHGFAWDRFRVDVHDAEGRARPLPRDWSIHPPKSPSCAFEAWLGHALAQDALCEVMYPGYHLGSGAEVGRAMDEGLRLALDVSHLHLQERAGTIDAALVRRVLEYDRIEEVHVSDNDGRADSHKPISHATPDRHPSMPSMTEQRPTSAELREKIVTTWVPKRADRAPEDDARSTRLASGEPRRAWPDRTS